MEGVWSRLKSHENIPGSVEISSQMCKHLSTKQLSRATPARLHNCPEIYKMTMTVLHSGLNPRPCKRPTLALFLHAAASSAASSPLPDWHMTSVCESHVTGYYNVCAV